MFRKKITDEEREDMRLQYDRVFSRACLECSEMLTGDGEVHRLSAAILSAHDLGEQAERYRKLEENIDRKLRSVLAARELGCRFDADPIRLVSHVCRKRGRLLVVAMIQGKGGRKSRQSIEATIREVK